MTKTQRAVRFWIWYNVGPVKIKLVQDQQIMLSRGGLTEEGYFHEVTSVYFDGEEVSMSIDRSSSDCDGPMYSHVERTCPISDLHAIEPYQHIDDLSKETIERMLDTYEEGAPCSYDELYDACSKAQELKDAGKSVTEALADLKGGK